MKIQTFVITWQAEFFRPQLINDWDVVTFVDITIIPSENLEIRWDAEEDIIFISANSSIVIDWERSTKLFPFEIRGGWSIIVLTT